MKSGFTFMFPCRLIFPSNFGGADGEGEGDEGVGEGADCAEGVGFVSIGGASFAVMEMDEKVSSISSTTMSSDDPFFWTLPKFCGVGSCNLGLQFPLNFGASFGDAVFPLVLRVVLLEFISF